MRAVRKGSRDGTIPENLGIRVFITDPVVNFLYGVAARICPLKVNSL